MKFGTSGLRGLVTDLEGRASALYTQAFIQHLANAGEVTPGGVMLVGRDLRPSSPSIASTCIGAIRGAGLLPVDCGPLPTPALALYGRKLGAPAMMITGSHIPADRNGIKFYRAEGEIGKADEMAIAACAAALFDAEAEGEYAPEHADNASAAALALFSTRARSILADGALADLRVGVYTHSTVARELLAETLRFYGAEVFELGWSDAFVAVDTEALPKDMRIRMQGWAGEHRLDAVVSADGDGDRPLVCDERGQPLQGDVLGLITAQFLTARTIVTPVTSNSGLEGAGAFNVNRTRVGSPFVIAGMTEALRHGHDKVLGFEANGGLLTASPFKVAKGVLDPLPTRDSFLPILSVLNLAATSGSTLSEIVAGLSLPVSMADRLEDFPVAISGALMHHLVQSRDHLDAFVAPLGRVDSIDDLDGLRIRLTDNRIVHLRPSGNAPEMRCYVEAATPQAASQLLESCLRLIRRWADQLQFPEHRSAMVEISA